MNPKKKSYSVADLQKRSTEAKIDLTKGMDIYRDAAKRNMSLSQYLELLDPSQEDDSLDAFGRQMALYGIRTVSNPKTGVYADKVERFYASNQPATQTLFPEFLNREMRQARLQQDITSEIVAVRTSIDSDTYRTTYVDTTALDTYRLKRVAESAEVPTAKLKTSENVIKLYKYGIRLLVTYEAIRRMAIDQLRVHLNLIAMQDGIDRGSTALDVAINGDGNNNAATNATAVSLDAAATTGVTYKAWIGWLMSFYPYQVTTVAGNAASLLAILTLQFPGVDPLSLLAQYAGNNTGMRVEMQPGVFVPIRLVLDNSLPTKTLVGIDKRFGIEEVSEIGASLTETNKIISQQFNEIVFTEVLGYGKMYAPAVRTMTFA